LMVRRWVRDKMRERKMRVVHQEQWLDVITNLCFVPSERDIHARELLMSNLARSMLDRFRGSLYTWWGSRVREPFRRD